MGIDAFVGIETAIQFLIIMCIVSVPLGLWKLIEIIIWIVKFFK